MNSYTVRIPVIGVLVLKGVEAASPEEAKSQAYNNAILLDDLAVEDCCVVDTIEGLTEDSLETIDSADVIQTTHVQLNITAVLEE